jgi:hypothetical protein
MSFSRALVLFASLAAGFLTACSDEPEMLQQGSAPLPPPPPTPPRSTLDLDPPLFAGVQKVELLGEHMLRASWDPGRDNVTPAESLRYEVYHHVDLFREPADGDEPVATAPAGATSLVFGAELPGRVYVRAVDEAGLRSALGGSLYQRVERPIVTARDSRPVARVLSCASLGPGMAACAGRDGFAARWDRDHWTTLDVPAGLTWHLERTPDAVYLFSELGHLYLVGADGSLEGLAVRFDQTPTLPLQRFTLDPLGLMYWIDDEGVVFVGVPGDFRQMEHPLALPAADGCARLQTLMFSGNSGFAICEDGTVYSARLDSASFRWSSLTVSTPHNFNSSVVGVFAVNDTEGMMFGPDGVHRVGVGGWTPVLPMGEPLSSMDPRSPVPSTLFQLEQHGPDLMAATDIGVLQGPDGFFDLVPGTDIATAGFILPTPLEPSDLLGLITPDASVASVRGGRLQWTVAPRLTGFITGASMPDGQLVAATEDRIYLLNDDEWEEIAPTPTQGSQPMALRFVHRDSARGGLLVGAVGEAGNIVLRRTPAGWAPITLSMRDLESEQRAMDRLREAALRQLERQTTTTVEGSAPPLVEPSIPLQPMLARTARSNELPPMSEPVDIDTHTDGRGVLATRHEIWWRVSDGNWILLAQREGNINAVALDAGPGYVIVEDGQPLRCVREVCEDGVQEATGTPLGSRAVWRTSTGLHAMLGDASVVQFQPAEIPEGTPPLVAVSEMPAGSWVQEQTASAATLPNGRLEGRFQVDGADLIWLSDGSVFQLIEGNWILQGRVDGGFALWSNESTWGIVGAQGLLTLAPVPDVTF